MTVLEDTACYAGQLTGKFKLCVLIWSFLLGLLHSYPFHESNMCHLKLKFIYLKLGFKTYTFKGFKGPGLSHIG